MVLPSIDCYAVILVAFFAKLDGYAEFTRPHKPPAPDLRDGNETLQNYKALLIKKHYNGGRSITCSLGNNAELSNTTGESTTASTISGA